MPFSTYARNGIISSREIFMKRQSLAINVLKGIAMTSTVLLSASNPYFGLRLIKNWRKYSNKDEWRRFYLSLNYLRRRGYVRILNRTNDGIKVEITRLGRKEVANVNIDELMLPANQKWDGKWRLVIYDVPNKKNKNRLAFAEKLKTLGFIMVQKSVWAYPFECYKEVMILRKFYEIERYVAYLEAIEIEDELDWRGKFNLKNQT